MIFRAFFLWLIQSVLLFAAPLINWEKNEMVVMLGDTLFERDYREGYLETALSLATAGKNLRMRNLGWSGDTPRCESRSYFGPPAEGFERLSKQLAEIKPSIVICCYGAVDAFQGEVGIASFIASYEKLLEMIHHSCGAKVILMSPPAVSSDVARFPSLANHMEDRGNYSKAIQQLASAKSHAFADLFSLMKNQDWQTVHGVTFTDDDYRRIAPLFVRSLGWEARAVDANQQPLRAAIVAKNHFFFQRWRPQNEIYLFGSRKHEQGRNGAEIPQFDPLIAEKEQLIFRAIPTK